MFVSQELQNYHLNTGCGRASHEHSRTLPIPGGEWAEGWAKKAYMSDDPQNVKYNIKYRIETAVSMSAFS